MNHITHCHQYLMPDSKKNYMRQNNVTWRQQVVGVESLGRLSHHCWSVQPQKINPHITSWGRNFMLILCGETSLCQRAEEKKSILGKSCNFLSDILHIVLLCFSSFVFVFRICMEAGTEPPRYLLASLSPCLANSLPRLVRYKGLSIEVTVGSVLASVSK